MDQEGEAQQVRVKDVRLGEESVVFLSDVGADYTLDAEISFEADVRYPDRDFIAYDDETGNYIYYNFIEETLHRTLEVPLDVSLRFDSG
jgi:hypothetical protein